MHSTAQLAMYNAVQYSTAQCFGSSRLCAAAPPRDVPMALVAGDDDRRRATGRRLTRNKSDAEEPVEIQQVTCIRGGARKSWLVLPLKTINGRQCAGFAPYTSWLHQLLNGGCGHSRGEAHVGAITNFFKECLAKFKESSRQQGPEPIQGCEPSHAQGSGAGKKGRAAVMSDSDDDKEEDEAASQIRPKKRARAARRERRTPRGEFITSKIRGMEFCYTIGVGPRVFIPINGPWVENMIQDLLSRRDEVRKHGDKAESQGGGPSSLLTDADRGRICWRARTSTVEAAWQICFTNAHGVMKNARAGLAVPSTALSGEPITESAFLDNARQVLKKARREWNRVDHSGGERYAGV